LPGEDLRDVVCILLGISTASEVQTPGKFPEEYKLYSEHGESLKTTIRNLYGEDTTSYFRRRGNSQKNTNYILNTAKVSKLQDLRDVSSFHFARHLNGLAGVFEKI
jgi:hypothetical protein